MDNTADFDLYVFKLNETDGTLELVGGSAIIGTGCNSKLIFQK